MERGGLDGQERVPISFQTSNVVACPLGNSIGRQRDSAQWVGALDTRHDADVGCHEIVSLFEPDTCEERGFR